MQIWIDGNLIGSVEVSTNQLADYKFRVASLQPGATVDVVYVNDAVVNDEDRTLVVASLDDGVTAWLPIDPMANYDLGVGAMAFDGVNLTESRNRMSWSGALRLKWPTYAASPVAAARADVSRFLQQATFGPRAYDVDALLGNSYDAWLTAQYAMTPINDFVACVQRRYDMGDAWRPRGANYNPGQLNRCFWAVVANAPDQLRRRMAFALHQIFMVSLSDSTLYNYSRAYGSYLDILNRHALGNFRVLLEEVALSPAMGLYLSHMRNRKEDPVTGRMPDENFAREVMQLFTIGLEELNPDGTPRLDANGRRIETYTNNDVMAMAKVFTGFSWALPDSQLSERNFLLGGPDFSQSKDQKIDLLRMKPYPGQHSTAEKRLFDGKPHAVVIPADSTAQTSVKIALDALFEHPNVGPFIGRQLIQRLVSSNPSPAYVARVTRVFNDNGNGQRGDLFAVVRAILLDPEARQSPAAGFGKLREPVLRVTHWMRSFDAVSASGEYMLENELESLQQRPLYAPSVFGYFRPGYVHPGTAWAATGATVPEFQITNESTTIGWINLAERMAGSGLGATVAGAPDVASSFNMQSALIANGNINALLEHLNHLLLGGTMSANTRRNIINTVGMISGRGTAQDQSRARAAVFIAMSSPEYLVQQ